MFDGAFCRDVIGKVLHLIHRSLEDTDLEAVFRVEMHMQACDRQVVVVVEGVGQPAREIARGMIVDIAQHADAGLIALRIAGCFLQSRSHEIADCLRPVLISTRRNKRIELLHQVIVKGDRHTLHPALPV